MVTKQDAENFNCEYKNNIPNFDSLIMRPDVNFESDHELKPAMLAAALGGMDEALRRVAFALEDRDKVVAAWRKLGFNCMQVRAGAF